MPRAVSDENPSLSTVPPNCAEPAVTAADVGVVTVGSPAGIAVPENVTLSNRQVPEVP
jgi:hypothetical protein